MRVIFVFLLFIAGIYSQQCVCGKGRSTCCTGTDEIPVCTSATPTCTCTKCDVCSKCDSCCSLPNCLKCPICQPVETCPTCSPKSECPKCTACKPCPLCDSCCPNCPKCPPLVQCDSCCPKCPGCDSCCPNCPEVKCPAPPPCPRCPTSPPCPECRCPKPQPCPPPSPCVCEGGQCPACPAPVKCPEVPEVVPVRNCPTCNACPRCKVCPPPKSCRPCSDIALGKVVPGMKDAMVLPMSLDRRAEVNRVCLCFGVPYGMVGIVSIMFSMLTSVFGTWGAGWISIIKGGSATAQNPYLSAVNLAISYIFAIKDIIRCTHEIHWVFLLLTTQVPVTARTTMNAYRYARDSIRAANINAGDSENEVHNPNAGPVMRESNDTSSSTGYGAQWTYSLMALLLTMNALSIVGFITVPLMSKMGIGLMSVLFISGGMSIVFFVMTIFHVYGGKWKPNHANIIGGNVASPSEKFMPIYDGPDLTMKMVWVSWVHIFGIVLAFIVSTSSGDYLGIANDPIGIINNAVVFVTRIVASL